MMYVQLAALAERSGFSAWAPLDITTVDLKQAVRNMCAANTCGMYGKRWSCPPGCGTLEECARRLKRYTHGILVQTVGTVGDSFDFEAMAEIEEHHKARLAQMYEALQKQADGVLAIGSGCCTVCVQCTYPEKPCRFPEKMIASMEAYGMLVLEICKANGLQYYYGSDKIAYTGCFLL